MKYQRSVSSIAIATLMLVSLCAVCTSTSVSAADGGSSRASVEASSNLVGGVAAGTGPSACILVSTNTNGNLYLFAKGSDGALWYTNMSLVGEGNTWAPWASLGGQLTSSPCAVSRSSGYLDVYVRGTDGAIWEMCYGGAWHGWYKVGGQVASGTGPAASGWPGREDVFVTGTDGAMWQLTWTAANGWATTWAYLTGALTSSPAAVSRGSGLIDVHVRGTDGADWHRSYASGTWSSWLGVTGKLAPGTGPALSVDRSSSPSDIVDLFVTGTDGAIWQKTWSAASGWSSWGSLGGHPTSSPTAAWADDWHGIELYVRWNDGFVWQKEYYADNGVYQWHIWQGGDQAPP